MQRLIIGSEFILYLIGMGVLVSAIAFGLYRAHVLKPMLWAIVTYVDRVLSNTQTIRVTYSKHDFMGGYSITGITAEFDIAYFGTETPSHELAYRIMATHLPEERSPHIRKIERRNRFDWPIVVWTSRPQTSQPAFA